MNPALKVFDTIRLQIVADLGSGHVRLIASRYLLGAFLLGVVLTTILVLISTALGFLIVLSLGSGIGYAARSLVSWRRREAWLRKIG